jgi:hypothetical protein
LSERPSEWWYEKAADAIVREGKTLFLFSNENDLGLTSRECDNVQRTKAFQEVLRQRRNLYYKEIAQDPSLSRAAIKGQLVLAINKLLEKEQYDKAATAIMQLAKLEGWTSDGTSVNIIEGLTAKDLTELKKKFTPTVLPSEKLN